ncbi:uncharacterized protein [Dermacentor albipictus]|uniref:uncharacterized protein isoform X4 n=1 Tax=Dermacentor albipictus TaxID=60249 RepID=UPI0038FD1055
MPGTSLGPRCDKATSRALYRSANPQGKYLTGGTVPGQAAYGLMIPAWPAQRTFGLRPRLRLTFVGMITATAERSEARSEEGRRWQGVVDETAIPPQERYKRQRVGNRAPCISSLTQYVASTWYFFPSDNKVRLVAEMKFTAAILLVALLTAFMGTITAADERNDEARTGDIYGSGCPDSSACTKSCKAKGLNLGVCLEPLLKICLCS